MLETMGLLPINTPAEETPIASTLGIFGRGRAESLHDAVVLILGVGRRL